MSGGFCPGHRTVSLERGVCVGMHNYIDCGWGAQYSNGEALPVGCHGCLCIAGYNIATKDTFIPVRKG